jgi:hypothetical protein
MQDVGTCIHRSPDVWMCAILQRCVNQVGLICSESTSVIYLVLASVFSKQGVRRKECGTLSTYKQDLWRLEQNTPRPLVKVFKAWGRAKKTS